MTGEEDIMYVSYVKGLFAEPTCLIVGTVLTLCSEFPSHLEENFTLLHTNIFQLLP